MNLTAPDMVSQPARMCEVKSENIRKSGSSLSPADPASLFPPSVTPRASSTTIGLPRDIARLQSRDSPIDLVSEEKLSYSTLPQAARTPENNKYRFVEYRNEKVASFNVDGRLLLCLPQAFDLFLKDLVGGLHTVYTKLKRLNKIPVVCNVEQVRILRQLQVIHPGVNRCKLIAPEDFDELYIDCTSQSSRPGRPPKRNCSLIRDLPSPPSKIVRRSEAEYIEQLKKEMLLRHTYSQYQQPSVATASAPTLPLSFLPPYNINQTIMQQAAMSMAFASQFSRSNQMQSVAAAAVPASSAPSLPSSNTAARTSPLHDFNRRSSHAVADASVRKAALTPVVPPLQLPSRLSFSSSPSRRESGGSGVDSAVFPSDVHRFSSPFPDRSHGLKSPRNGNRNIANEERFAGSTGSQNDAVFRTDSRGSNASGSVKSHEDDGVAKTNRDSREVVPSPPSVSDSHPDSPLEQSQPGLVSSITSLKTGLGNLMTSVDDQQRQMSQELDNLKRTLLQLYNENTYLRKLVSRSHSQEEIESRQLNGILL